jgi:opacity protein-like surface antigen
MAQARIIPGSGIALIVGLAAFGLDGRAIAADYLRGPYAGEAQPQSESVDWAGVYGGVHAGITSGQTDPRSMAAPLAQNALPNTVITDTVASMISFKESNKQGASYGAFIGVNWQWDDIVLGIEADYTHSSIKANSTSTQARTVRPTGTTDEYAVIATSTSRAKISDWATLRGRVGYAAGMFMPFLTAGVAFGNLDGRATTNGTWERYDVSGGAPVPYPAPFFTGNFAGVVGRRGITYGGAFGAGIDMQLIPNTFLRAEWQYIQFASGGQRPEVSINTARVAGGVKF